MNVPILTIVVASPAPNSPSFGNPQWPWSRRYTSSALAGTAASVIQSTGSRPVDGAHEAADGDEPKRGRDGPDEPE